MCSERPKGTGFDESVIKVAVSGVVSQEMGRVAFLLPFSSFSQQAVRAAWGKDAASLRGGGVVYLSNHWLLSNESSRGGNMAYMQPRYSTLVGLPT